MFTTKAQHRKNVINVEAFRPNSYLREIINYCHLQSKNDWHVWYDLMGNRLRVQSSILIEKDHENDLSCQDIYFKAPMAKILQMSKKIYFSKDYILLYDGLTLRCYDQYLKPNPPLVAGYGALKRFFKNINENKIKDIFGIQDLPLKNNLGKFEEIWQKIL